MLVVGAVGVAVTSEATTAQSPDPIPFARHDIELANEMTEDRPWQGEYRLVALCGRALSEAAVVANYTAGPVVREGPDLTRWLSVP